MESNQKKKTATTDILKILNSAIVDMADLPKKMLKYATPITLSLLAVATVLFVQNKTSSNFSSVFDFTTTTLITNSIFVMAEFIIASLVIDMIVKKKPRR